MKLLLVEDDAVVCVALARTLSRRGILIEACGDGLAALAIWQTMSFDVTLLDLTLPGLDGLQVLAQARQSGLNTPVSNGHAMAVIPVAETPELCETLARSVLFDTL